MNINEKELIKQIKASKNNLIWSVQDDVHYITNRHWAVKYETLPTSVLTALFVIFAKIPSNDSGIMTVYGMNEVQPMFPNLDIAKLMKISDCAKIGNITNVLQDAGKSLMRVIKCGKKLYFVDGEYIKMVNDFNEKPLISRAIHFCEGNLVIMPFRIVNVTHKEIIQDLIG